jgi:hypothetical protein
MSISKLKNDLIRWNIKFPLDREYRKANNIVFGSKQHREINQTDLYFQYLEDTLYLEMIEKIRLDTIGKKELEKGNWLKEEADVEEQEADELFAKLKVEDISNLKIED